MKGLKVAVIVSIPLVLFWTVAALAYAGRQKPQADSARVSRLEQQVEDLQRPVEALERSWSWPLVLPVRPPRGAVGKEFNGMMYYYITLGAMPNGQTR